MATVQPNFRSPEASMREAQRVWHRLFEHSPVPILLLTPDLKIVDANASYLSAVSRARQALAGLAVFDAFPDNPHVPGANGVSNLAASFEKVLHEGRGHVMPLQRYDIQPDGRPWQVRYWHPKNWPVVDDRGSIVALVHHVTDATASVLARKGVKVTPNPDGAETLLQRADRAILDARETIREAREDILLSRAMRDVSWHRFLKSR